MAHIAYFGKIPSRGDFIKATDNLPLVTILDEWLAHAMELLATEPRWKIAYDAAMPMHFAFVGPHSKRAIAGHLVASRDQAKRRFPFLAVCTAEVEDPLDFINQNPMAFSRLWSWLESQVATVLAAQDPAESLRQLTVTDIPLQLGPGAYQAVYSDFTEIQTMGSLQQLLTHAGFPGSLRQMILALGILLQPLLNNADQRLQKNLVIPLPDDPLYKTLTASFLLHLITPFILHDHFELAIILTRLDGKSVMIIGFNGASPRTLQSIMDSQIASDNHISFDEASWVEEPVSQNSRLQKLSSYLAQSALSLKSAHDSYRDAFIGA
ncbi:type VI secretion system-associated protein TagF [Herbaspirillum sp. RTI4]|uniref:type VI secretion system-associated protein TagF n=1 Tax=Herbaspirillum sp. RTI4 TaxID=3048640 RepID=UPI002AB4EAD2|nr:type VI secretion system-associated protein TagF [Herbaspirillum sp. RTI4]MDY7579040.1 type VI secretion system-associated protein TagF [Herbaspirillum sp. RTI4]MEA9982375.1 type VI secretion system-associated protein TagF [Herbaspirillum sp. RTI4]